LKIIS